jgi:NAD(P)-dependent dehydrogenase (short-subunit alcohol dehydrogenase family)
MQDFQGKVAVSIGLGMARAFSGAGMKLVIADLDDVALTSVVDEFRAAGTEVIGQRCDVSDHSAIQSLADATIAEFGAVHVLCNNAGVGIPTATHKMKLPDWKWIIDVCLWGPIYGIDVFLPLIEEQGEGHINSTSSMAGLVASQMMGAYNVAKHGVVALMATLERDLRGRESQVTSSVLCPGPINTNISRHSVQFRPGQAKPKTDGETSGRVARSIQDILEKGMDPDDVGLMVLDAIANDKFWVLTHPRWTKAVQRMVDAMNDDQTLSRA